MIRHASVLLGKSLAVLISSVVIELLGLPLVALGLLFRREYPETTRPFTQYPGSWTLVRLPSWLLLWDNPFDGMRGDKRGWWHNYCGDSARFWNMWWWGAVRNPANYFGRIVTGVDVSRCVVRKLAGNDEVIEEPGYRCWQFLVAERDDGGRFHRFFLSWAYPGRPDKSLLIDIGWKIKLEHNGMPSNAEVKDRVRGSVFTISPWKELR